MKGTTMQPCKRCARLDGEASAVAPHGALVLEDRFSVQLESHEAGVVETYLCRHCQARLRRFCNACSLDGWLLLHPQADVHRTAVSGR